MADGTDTLEAFRYTNFVHLRHLHDELAADHEALMAAHNRLVREHNHLVDEVAELRTLFNRLRRSQTSSGAITHGTDQLPSSVDRH
jgi:hypothetical protein